jgi:hypothetical protein
MDAMVEQTIAGDTLKREQGDLTRSLISDYCERFGATTDHFAETSGIDRSRLHAYMIGKIELSDREYEQFFTLASKLERVKR